METNWYMDVNGQTHGPYTWAEMVDMATTGQIVASTKIYHEQLGGWEEALSVQELGLKQATNSPMHQQEGPPTQNKKKYGCLKGCLSVVVLIVIGVILVLVFNRPGSKNNLIKSGKEQVVSEETIDMNGGTIVVDDSKSEINGLIIEVPASSYGSSKTFEISTREIKEHDYGENFNPILPIIHVDNGGQMANEFMTITVPIDIDDSLFAMACYYNEDGSLEPISMLSQSNDELVIGVTHFSDIVITALQKALLDDYIEDPYHDSGYRPGVDNWSFDNMGSEIAGGGACAGMTLSSIHYFMHHRILGEQPLHAYLDNNHYSMTPDWWKDDSMGVRLAGVVQSGINWAGYHTWTVDYLHETKLLSDKTIFYHFAYAFLLTDGAPQGIALFVRSGEGSKGKIEDGHAIVAYAMDITGIYVCDPNYPDRTDLIIPFDGTDFGEYVTALQADADTSRYNSFSLLGTTSLYSSGLMEDMFEEAKKNPYKSTIGDGLYTNVHFKALLLEDEDLKWVDDVEVIELLPEQSTKYKTKVTSYISRADMSAALRAKPDDWDDKAYILIWVQSSSNHYGLEIYSGANTTPYYDRVNGGTSAYIFVPLEEGLNNIGLYFSRERNHHNADNTKEWKSYDFIDFMRTNIYYGEEDLTGTWKGDFQITEFDQVMEQAEGLAFQITKGLAWITSNIFDTEFTEQELREIAQDSIEVNEDLEKPIPITVVLSDKNGQTYKAHVTMQTDAIYDYETMASFDGELVTFSASFDDGSTMDFSYDLYDNRTMSGEFDIEFNSVKDYVKGLTELKKVE